jgi:SAM-dependent methyltransferase
VPPQARVADLSAATLALLRTPGGQAELVRERNGLRRADGDELYPLANGIPVLLPMDSPFSAVEYPDRPSPAPRMHSRVRASLRRVLPSLSHNLSAERNLARMGELLRADAAPATALVLVVGGATLGEGMEALATDRSIVLVEADVAVGPRTQLICDAHALPFADGVFDGVVCQAVLEHVADPQRVVAEIRRVLKPNGLVYTEIPFMQQVHEGAYDFTRFTYNGQRRLLRCFEEIDAGATAGPGMALGWSVRALLTALAGERAPARSAANVVATLTLFWVKYLDRPLMRGARALDGASGIYFLGRARAAPRSDSEIIAGYRGVNSGFSVSR